MSNLLCIVAGQRTGTTALRSALHSTGAFHNFGEIFQTTTTHHAGNFLAYAKNRHLEVAEMAMPEQARAVALDYLNSLAELAGARIPLIDVKLNSWQIIRPFWGYLHEPPSLMRILARQNCTFLFIRRRDLAAQIMSACLARSAGKWHELKQADVRTPITLEIADVKQRAALILQSEAALLSFLSTYRRLISTYYEDLFVDNRLNGSVLSQLSAIMKIPLPEPRKLSLEKNDLNKKALVCNFDEVARAVADVVAEYGRPELTPRAGDISRQPEA
jgi:LPS sulfotransferase NodH